MGEENKDPYEGYTREEIQEAFRIAREDGMHVHKTYAAFQKQREEAEKAKKEPPAGETPKDGDPPPPKQEPNEPPAKKSLWWGDRA